ncbi:MAG: A/G-specific adenine glycosylase [Ilumatobacteraceae bacterium]
MPPDLNADRTAVDVTAVDVTVVDVTVVDVTVVASVTVADVSAAEVSAAEVSIADGSAADVSAADVSAADVTAAVLAWGGPRLRDLPWRRSRDPWAVLVSEVMLQQTRVPRVIPKWHEFLERFPTPASCAAAPLGDVLRLWNGLGYPRRARNLHTAAGVVAAAGGFPATLDGLRALPGVGPYTARALLAFAFDADVAVVDTNIARVLARIAGRRLTPRQVQAAADELVPSGDGWLWNQAIMDLGAVLCRPQSPGCAMCPVAAMCAFHGDGDDPAVGSAGVSVRQAPFEGSDRQARGRVLKALNSGPVRRADVAALTIRGDVAAAKLVAGLVADGLIVDFDGILRLPH